VIVLGLNAYHGDVSAAIVADGRLVAAVEEERFRRIKHIAGFPNEAIQACLTMAGVSGRDVNHVAVSRNPRAHLWRKGAFALTHRPKSGLVRDRAENYQRVRQLPRRARLRDLPCHRSHGWTRRRLPGRPWPGHRSAPSRVSLPLRVRAASERASVPGLSYAR